MEIKDLQELFKHPGWQVYLSQIEEAMTMLFMEMWGLEPARPESYVKFVELKAKIDQLRNITYIYERELAGPQTEQVDKTYYSRFVGILKRLLRRP